VIRGLAGAILSIALLALAAAPSSGQEAAAWFERAPGAAGYASIRGAAEAAAARLRAAGLPDGLLAARLEEGARKRIAPERLAAALADEAVRYEAIAAELSSRGLLPELPSEAGGLAERAGLLMRGGTALAEIAAALDAAPRGSAARAERALSAVAAEFSIHARFPLAPAERIALAAALAGSALGEERFASLLAVFARYRAEGLPASRICSLSVDILGAGGSVEGVERELQRRIRRP